jgi:2-polyprenyl-3-methyl-5-hydroxy-6-metoxy-1,4-benzoquinol methylase
MIEREHSIPYDKLGIVYDQESHEEITNSFYRSIRRVVRGVGKDLVLDLGCGTGLLTEQLAQHPCRIRAVDQSVPMLRAARARCKAVGSRVEFERGDITALNGSGLAAAAFACGDIVNHFPNDQVVASFFRSVYEHLQEGGVFVFDALSEWGFRTYWSDRTYYMSGKHGDLVMECNWDPNEKIGTADIIVFARVGSQRYTRRRTRLHERLIDQHQMRRMLRTAGFSKVDGKSWSPWSDQWRERANDRILWTAVK